MIAKDGQVVLSKRLQMLADMVSRGNRLVDVGCDHGFLSVRLVQQGICPGALAMDVRKGPLAAAETHVRECGLKDYIETRLSDGLLAYNAGEADTLVCAGMGGPLIEKILSESFDKVKQLKELILQPQSEIAHFRSFLRENGLVITGENAVIDEEKYYFAMKAVWGESVAFVGTGECAEPAMQLYDAYGEHLLTDRHPVLRDFLVYRREHLTGLHKQLSASASDKAKQRMPEVETELLQIARALSFYEN